MCLVGRSCKASQVRRPVGTQAGTDRRDRNGTHLRGHKVDRVGKLRCRGLQMQPNQEDNLDRAAVHPPGHKPSRLWM
jgi:hypothetical protein